MIALVIGKCSACEWPKLTVHFAMIITLLLQGALHIRSH